MMRLENWENRLNAVIERHWAAPFNYGRSDCFIFPADAVQAVTGERIFSDCRRYRSELGAARLLRRHGFETVADAFACLFETVPVALAGRGDIGVVRNADITSGGVFTGLGFLTRGQAGLIEVARTDIDTAFRVI